MIFLISDAFHKVCAITIGHPALLDLEYLAQFR
jgi:hypothetical protein